ncbi:hypothetical protein S245_054432, partial [Arachis hypogaea]
SSPTLPISRVQSPSISLILNSKNLPTCEIHTLSPKTLRHVSDSSVLMGWELLFWLLICFLLNIAFFASFFYQ